MEVRLKQGYRVKTAPGEVHEELERIRAGGDLDPQSVVNASEPEDAVLHPEFEWDDPTAANKWRLEEAKYLVRSIEIIREETQKPARVYESITVKSDEPDERPVRAFRPIEEVMADPDLRDELLGSAIRDVLALKRRYSGLQELAQVFAAMDNFLMTAEA